MKTLVGWLAVAAVVFAVLPIAAGFVPGAGQVVASAGGWWASFVAKPSCGVCPQQALWVLTMPIVLIAIGLTVFYYLLARDDRSHGPLV